jgi:hypothetical protein
VRWFDFVRAAAVKLGGSNGIANLYPEKASPSSGFHVPDRLESRLH